MSILQLFHTFQILSTSHTLRAWSSPFWAEHSEHRFWLFIIQHIRIVYQSNFCYKSTSLYRQTIRWCLMLPLFGRHIALAQYWTEENTLRMCNSDHMNTVLVSINKIHSSYDCFYCSTYNMSLSFHFVTRRMWSRQHIRNIQSIFWKEIR